MQSAQSTFVSGAYWTERIGTAAALATIRKPPGECAAAPPAHRPDGAGWLADSGRARRLADHNRRLGAAGVTSPFNTRKPRLRRRCSRSSCWSAVSWRRRRSTRPSRTRCSDQGEYLQAAEDVFGVVGRRWRARDGQIPAARAGSRMQGSPGLTERAMNSHDFAHEMASRYRDEIIRVAQDLVRIPSQNTPPTGRRKTPARHTSRITCNVMD